MKKPEVSICVPVFNGEKFLQECLDSILAQDFKNFELVVVDDASSDRSAEIASSLKDPRVRFYRNASRLGLVANWNRCLELAQGDYVCIFHQDDVMMPGNIGKKYHALNQNFSAGLVYSHVSQVGSEGETNNYFPYWQTCNPANNTAWPRTKAFEFLSARENPVCCPGVMVKKECYEKLGGFDETLPFTADWEMWMRISLFYGAVYLAEPLFKYRWHEGMQTRRFSLSANVGQKWKAKVRILEKYRYQIPAASEFRKKTAEIYSAQSWELGIRKIRGSFFEGVSCLLLSLRLRFS